MFKKTKNIISVLFTLVKFCLIKMIRGERFKFSFVERFSPNTMINLYPKGQLILGNKVRAHSGTKLSVTQNAVMKIGDNTTINYNCIFVAKKRIIIGKDVAFGPNVIMYDHDHDYRKSGVVNSDEFKCGDIVIGDNVWIGANAIILRGTHIGDNCVVAAGTVVKGDFEDNTVIYNEKITKIKKYVKG